MEVERLLAKSKKLRRKGAHAKALSLITEGCHRSQYDPELWMELAVLAEETSDLSTAADAWFRTGELYLRAGSLRDAQKFMYRALALVPRHGGARHLMRMIDERIAPAEDPAVEASPIPEQVPLPPPSFAEVDSDEDEDEDEDIEHQADMMEVELEVVEEPAQQRIDPGTLISPETVEFRRATAIANAVLSSPLLLRLNSDAIAELSQGAAIVDVVAGHTVYERDADADAVYLVTRGKARIFVGDRALYTAETGRLIGPEALLGTEAYASRAIALTDCRLLKLHATTLGRLDATQPGLIANFIEHAAGLLRAIYLVGLSTSAHADIRAVRQLVRASELRQVANNETIVKQGERPDGLYFILDGDFKSVRSMDGGARLTCSLAPGEFAFAGVLLSGSSAQDSLESRSAGWVIFTPRESAAALMATHPTLLERVAS